MSLSQTERQAELLAQHHGERGRWGVAGPPPSGKGFAEPTAERRYPSDRLVGVSALDVGISIDPTSPEISVDTRILLGVPRLSEGVPWLDLSDEHAVDAVEDAAGQPIAYRHADDRLELLGLSADGGWIRVRSHSRPSRGLYFTGPVPSDPSRPPMAWSQCQDEDAHYLFPCADAPGCRQPISARIRVPGGLEVVGNGRLISRTEGPDGWVTWSWEESASMPVYLFTVVVGPLMVVEDHGASVPVRYLVPAPADPAMVRRVFGRTPAMIAAFEERLGVPFPWPRYDQVVVHDFVFGGMENAGATTLTDLVLTDDSAAWCYDADDLIAHELAHQWFGDLVTCQDWSQAWLNEGWATYCETLWLSIGKGEDEAVYHLFGHLSHYLEESGGRYSRALVERRFQSPIDVFDRHLYEKGALVLHTLRGEIGDAAFWSGVRRYLEVRAWTSVHTRDLQRQLELASGRNLDRFFEDFVLGAGHPTLKVKVEHKAGLLQVTVEQAGESPNDSFLVSLPVEVEDAQGGIHRRRISLQGPKTTWTLPLSEAPVRVSVDPHLALLADLTLSAPRSLLVSSLRSDPGVAGRIRAAKALAGERTPVARGELIKALQSEPFYGVRVSLAGMLGETGHHEARDGLLTALNSESDARVRRAIVDALGGFVEDSKVAAALTTLLDGSEPSLHVRGEALKSLGRVRAPLAKGLLLSALKVNSWGDHLRVRAAEGLGYLQNPDLLEELLTLTREPASQRLVGAAVGALGRLARDRRELLGRVEERLCTLAVDAPFRVRLAAIGSLGASGGRGVLPVLDSIHRGDPDGRLARSAWEAAEKVLKRGQPGDELATLRAELERLRKSQQALEERVAELAAKLPGDPS